ncbi:MAG TPA: hypothetical protein VJ914_28510 [Pseudonocardiaceae bacterium]|nr:hypothetical protein [Pseudonocardiaceae bacterium]
MLVAVTGPAEEERDQQQPEDHRVDDQLEDLVGPLGLVKKGNAVRPRIWKFSTYSASP